MVQGLPCAIDLFENVLGGGGPDEGFGCIVVFGEVVVDGRESDPISLDTELA